MNTTEYNTCVDAYADALFRFVFKNVRHQAIAEDAVQSAFEVLWQKRKDVSSEQAKSFLFTVAYRKMIDEQRRQMRVTLKEDIPDHWHTTSGHVQTDLKQHLHRAIEKLPDVQKQLILLRDYEGYSYQEIAGITGLNEGQVKINLYRARTFLKQALISVETSI
jgi:RNA polymerase sigma-70 factor (ECF subfamily)